MTISLLLVFSWVVVATFADTRFKAAAGVLTTDFWIGFASYAICSFGAIMAFRRASWGWIILIWNVLSLALSLFLSVVLYGEPLTRHRLVAALMLFGAFLLVGGEK
jgi:drug/metabolite transporter (DMT)-like permease